MPRRAVPGREDLPLVSVVLPVLNEEAHIQRCLASVQAQDYPAEMIEIVVADGGSTDRTRAIVERIAASDPRITLVDNPGRNQAAGLNRAIAASSGTIVARLDGHSAMYPAHLRRCVDLLRTTGADSVGGTQEAVAEGALTEAIASAAASPFGAGAAWYRYSEVQREVDTVFLGCFQRGSLDRVGPFNEDLPPHEDYELNYRIRATGGKIIFSPELPVRYWPRSSLRLVARQYFSYGRAKARVARITPGVVRPHHLAPPLLVLATIVLAAGMTSVRGQRRAGLLAGGYGLACAVAGLQAGRGKTALVRVWIPAVYPVLHFSWGTGFLWGLRRKPRKGMQGKRW